MGILNLWREARGSVLRKEYEDLMARVNGANQSAKSAFLNNVEQTKDTVGEAYAAASKAERKSILKEMRDAMREMWAGGDWPSALGLGISCLHAESLFTPGEDAAYVKLETGRLIQEASKNA